MFAFLYALHSGIIVVALLFTLLIWRLLNDSSSTTEIRQPAAIIRQIVPSHPQLRQNQSRILQLNPSSPPPDALAPLFPPLLRPLPLCFDSRHQIFSIVDTIYNYHQLLFETLESRIKRWLADNMAHSLAIGDIFIKMVRTILSQFIHILSCD